VLLFNILIFIGGLILLVKGAGLFVIASTSIAKRFGVPEFVCYTISTAVKHFERKTQMMRITYSQ
jgi:Ca2+/Na+ antiporter